VHQHREHTLSAGRHVQGVRPARVRQREHTPVGAGPVRLHVDMQAGVVGRCRVAHVHLSQRLDGQPAHVQPVRAARGDVCNKPHCRGGCCNVYVELCCGCVGRTTAAAAQRVVDGPGVDESATCPPAGVGAFRHRLLPPLRCNTLAWQGSGSAPFTSLSEAVLACVRQCGRQAPRPPRFPSLSRRVRRHAGVSHLRRRHWHVERDGNFVLPLLAARGPDRRLCDNQHCWLVDLRLQRWHVEWRHRHAHDAHLPVHRRLHGQRCDVQQLRRRVLLHRQQRAPGVPRGDVG
jgi:hypothetical protein